MTDWDQLYMSMRKPTDLKDLYPDPYGHFDELEDTHFERIVKYVVWGITTVFAFILVITSAYLYTQIQNL